jgi:transcription-repair coupling factor (superfamily II helicase)
MLEEAVRTLKEEGAAEREEQWSPTINVGTAVLLPEAYVPDLQTRLNLYRRLSGLHENADIENFSGELADRFGPMPEEVKHLLTVVQIKNYCRQAGIAQVDAGPKGALVTFRNKAFANPRGLVAFMHQQGANVKMQPDQKLVVRADWEDGVERLRGTRALARQLAEIAVAKEAPPPPSQQTSPAKAVAAMPSIGARPASGSKHKWRKRR